jgi:hypothetical protein
MLTRLEHGGKGADVKTLTLARRECAGTLRLRSEREGILRTEHAGAAEAIGAVLVLVLRL